MNQRKKKYHGPKPATVEYFNADDLFQTFSSYACGHSYSVNYQVDSSKYRQSESKWPPIIPFFYIVILSVKHVILIWVRVSYI